MLLLLLACAEPPPEPTCHGHAALCERSYDAVAQVATHNSMSSAQDDWLLPNQRLDVPTQLADGVRGFMLDTYEWEGEAWLCHSNCDLGAQRLVEGLIEVREFMDAHPTEVITFILQSALGPEMTEAALIEAGLDERMFQHVLGEPWPTLAALADAGTPLVVFTDRDGDAFPGYLPQWEHAWQNPYSYDVGDVFSCEVERGDGEQPVFILNHFVTDPVALEDNAPAANSFVSLNEHVMRCTDAGAFPTHVTVDFYDIGDVFEVVEGLNGF